MSDSVYSVFIPQNHFSIRRVTAEHYSGYDTRLGKSCGLLRVMTLSRGEKLWEHLTLKQKMEKMRAFRNESLNAWKNANSKTRKLWVTDWADPALNIYKGWKRYAR